MPLSAAGALLDLVHHDPGISRAEAAHRLQLTSGFAAETTARLVSRGLLDEAPAAPTGRRGRPTTSLHPHGEGPLVVGVTIAHESWQVAASQLGGNVVASVDRPHRRDLSRVRRAVADQVRRLHQRFGPRIRAVVVVVPGTVAATRLIQAPNLGWTDVDLGAFAPRPAGTLLLAGNDATLAGLAEAHRGAARGAGTSVHLYVDAGVGGTLVVDGRPVAGAIGAAGEFGHLPFGARSRRCPCGALGCWNTELDGAAVARRLGAPPPADDVTYIRAVVSGARRGPGPERRAVVAMARSLGRGAAALVNALDPAVVTLGGLGRDVLDLAAGPAAGAYAAGLMGFRSADPPPFVAGRFGAGGPLVGAVDEAFGTLLADGGLAETYDAAAGC